MIVCYQLTGDVLKPIPNVALDAIPDNAVWIDLLKPTREEECAVENYLNISIPTHEDMVEIEESSRFYMEDNAQFLTAPLLYSIDNERRAIAPITFILINKRLVTIRYNEPKAFSLYLTRTARTGNGLLTAKSTGTNILLGLLEAVTDRLADLLEAVSAKIGKASEAIFTRDDDKKPMTTADFRNILNEIGGQGTFLSVVRESIAGVSRLFVYVEAFNKTYTPPVKDISTALKSLERDMQSLEHYADFLSSKMTFLLDTVVGLISTEQNAIIKIFSVAAVGFMPPTLIASIYGMNFSFMPELREPWGYPLAILLMIMSAILPLVYFHKKGWL